MKNITRIFTAIVFISLFLFKTQAVLAENTPGGVSCKVHAFLVNDNYQLPYKNDGVEIVSGTSTLKPGNQVVLSFEIKNQTGLERIALEKVYVTQMAGAKEPIEIIGMKPQNGNCSINEKDKSIFCGMNYSFAEDAHYPVEFLVKLTNPITTPQTTSSLFSIETTGGSASCASYIQIKDDGQKNPISWSTPYAELKSDDFFIRIGDRKFYGVEPIRITSDPGTDKTTLEAIWSENGLEMRMFMYFQKVGNNMWEMYDLRTYNGNAAGGWIYYKDSSGVKPSGTEGNSNYSEKRTFVPTDGSDASINCNKCSIKAFLKHVIPISTYNYGIDFMIGLPAGKIITITNQPRTGYGVNAVLKDNLGKVVKDQNGFSYKWTADNSEIVYLTSGPVNTENGCAYGINPPCPNSNLQITGLKAGKTNINLSVIRNSDKAVIANNSFPIIVNDAVVTPTPVNCVNRNEIVKVNSSKTCCSGTVLIMPEGNRSDIIGICMQECTKDNDCLNGEICKKQTYNASFACEIGSRDNETVDQLKNEVNQLKQEVEKQKDQQNKLMEMIESIKQFLKNIFG
ncbi:MAG TPA: hypothetical protein PK639_04110 [Candidatus Woesebacteria bacterium]|nr:hypothetical protein [Candidatus Woesebacteria bacterium]